MKKQLRKLREGLGEGTPGRQTWKRRVSWDEAEDGQEAAPDSRPGNVVFYDGKVRARLHGELEGARGGLDYQSSSSSCSFSRKNTPPGVLGTWAGRQWIAQHKQPRRVDVMKEVARSNSRIREPCRV